MKRILLILIVLAAAGVLAATASENKSKSSDGNSLPRFVSLRSDKVYARFGPGVKLLPLVQRLVVVTLLGIKNWRKQKTFKGNVIGKRL
mgnify:CR=1 FL=1